MTLTYTPRLRLAVPDFLTEPWHAEFEQAMQSIDRLVYDALLMQGASLWVNSHAYVIGDVIINPDNGSLFTCAANNTSTASPQTFTQELVAHPTFWVQTAPTLASQAEAEAGVDNSKYMSPLRTAQAITALTAQSSQDTPRCGRLEFVNATTLQYKPYKGNRLKINGVVYEIPTVGIGGLTTTGTLVNNVAGNLAADTTYLVFATISGGNIVADFHTGVTHSPSTTVGNEGTEAMFSGVFFDTFTFIGIVRTNGSTQFVDSATQRLVRSWHNDPGRQLLNHFTTTRTRASAVYGELNTEIRVQWVQFADDPILLGYTGSVYSTTSTVSTIYTTIAVDTVVQDVFSAVNTKADTDQHPVSPVVALFPGEGLHTATVYGLNNAGTAGWFVDTNSAGLRPIMWGSLSARG